MGEQSPPASNKRGLKPRGSRLLRATATVDRIEPRRGDDWTGEYRSMAEESWLGDDTASRSVQALPAGPRGANEHREWEGVFRGRELKRLERGLRLACIAACFGLVAWIALDAIGLALGRFGGSGQPWRELSLRVRSTPSGANVFIDGRRLGATPLRVREFCRGQVIRIRVTAPRFASWTWNGRCPTSGPLELDAALQSLSD